MNNEKLRVGFFGVGGTGKTSVLLGLQKLGYQVHRSVARAVFSQNFITEKDLEAGIQAEVEKQAFRVQSDIFEAKLQQDIEQDGGVFERTLLDTFAYLLIYAFRNLSDVHVFNYEAVVRDNMKRYDVLIYFPMSAYRSPGDGFRSVGAAVSYTVDLILLGYMEKWKIPYTTIIPGTVEERIQFMDDLLKGKMRG